MDSGLEKDVVIYEPYVFDDIEDAGQYLWNKGHKVGVSTRTGYSVYHVRLSSEDLLVLKLLFPNILIKDNEPKEKVSTFA